MAGPTISSNFNTQSAPFGLTLDDRAEYYTSHTKNALTEERLPSGKEVIWGGNLGQLQPNQQLNSLTISYASFDGKIRTIGFNKEYSEDGSKNQYSVDIDYMRSGGTSIIRGIHPNEMPTNPVLRKRVFEEGLAVAHEAINGPIKAEMLAFSPRLSDDLAGMNKALIDTRQELSSPVIGLPENKR